MKVTYIDHSGFMVELEKTVLLFDYYKGTIPKVSGEKTLYVFASHKHPDHFNPEILNLWKQYDRIHFFLSKDIRINEAYLEKNHMEKELLQHITFLPRNTTTEWNEQEPLQIETLTSTDEGVAFVVECEGRKIYHAGDLNWWHWNGESKAYNRNMEVNYKREIDKLQDVQFDVAFVPLDDRLEDACGYGMRYFMMHVQANVIFPMHMWNHFGVVERFKIENKDIDTQQLMEITGDGMTWNI